MTEPFDPLHSFRSLLSLIEDADRKISGSAADVLKKTFSKWSPLLDSGQIILTPAQRNRLEPLIENWKREEAMGEWRGFVHREQNTLDLQQGLEILSLIQRPMLPLDFLEEKLERLAQEFRTFADLRGAGTMASPLQKALSLCDFLGDIKNFRGNTADYSSWRNSFIEIVLDTGLGIPISLSSVYILLGKRIGLTLFGVGLPGHLVIGFDDSAKTCYLDPYHGGELITRQECERIVRRYGQRPSEKVFVPLSGEEYFIRVINNIVNALDLSGDGEKSGLYKRCQRLLWSERIERRGPHPQRA